MILSMTGYGEGSAQDNGWEVAVKIKTLNHKYLDIYLKGLEEFELLELNAREILKDSFSRGRVEISFELKPEAEIAFALDSDIAAKYYHALKALAKKLKLEHPITLDHLARLPGALKPLPTESGELEPVLEKALRAAIKATMEMRKREGNALADELVGLIRTVAKESKEVESHAPELKEAYRVKLYERISELLENNKTDPGRLEQEVVLWAERTDITEETARLKIHLSAFEEAIRSGEPAGRTLDFLAQEMHREVNTMAAKARDALISQRIIEMKSHIDQLREQVRNVE
ncbi:YicC family protein [Candidatus Acetothermia bacterium]|nr:YicC family protein [Candidatus Acetothermia bacterium]MBI3643152.1 YicC family protein [Candidatus Acetothermia bacterium]